MTFWVRFGRSNWDSDFLSNYYCTEMERKTISFVGTNASSNVFVNMCAILTGRQPPKYL